MENVFVRVEVEGLKTTVCQMLADYSGKQQEAIQKAVSAACTPENIESVIELTAEKAIRGAITEEVESFFRYGRGRKAIREAVEKQLAVDE